MKTFIKNIDYEKYKNNILNNIHDINDINNIKKQLFQFSVVFF